MFYGNYDLTEGLATNTGTGQSYACDGSISVISVPSWIGALDHGFCMAQATKRESDCFIYQTLVDVADDRIYD